MRDSRQRNFFTYKALAYLSIITQFIATSATTVSILFPYNWNQTFTSSAMFDYSAGGGTCCPLADTPITFSIQSPATVKASLPFQSSCTATMSSMLPSSNTLTLSSTNTNSQAFINGTLVTVFYQHNNSIAIASNIYSCLWILSNSASVPTGQTDFTIPLTQTWNFIGTYPNFTYAAMVYDTTLLTNVKLNSTPYTCCMPDPTQPIVMSPNQTLGVAPATMTFSIPFMQSVACTVSKISGTWPMNETMLGGASNDTFFGYYLNVMYFPYNTTLGIAYQGCTSYYISSSPPNVPLQTCDCIPPFAQSSSSRLRFAGSLLLLSSVISYAFMT